MSHEAKQTIHTLQRIDPEEHAYRFYQLELVAEPACWKVLQRWGRIGEKVRERVQELKNEEEAWAYLRKLKSQKLQRGYTELEGSAIPQEVSEQSCFYCCQSENILSLDLKHFHLMKQNSEPEEKPPQSIDEEPDPKQLNWLDFIEEP